MPAENMTFKQRWQSMPTKNRMILVGGGAVTLLFLVAINLSASKPPVIAKPVHKPATQVGLGIPGGGGTDLSIEKLSASVEAVQNQNKDLRDKITQQQKEDARRELEEQQRNARQGGQGSQSPETIQQLKQLREELASIKAKQEKLSSLDEALPGIDPARASSVAAQPPVESPKLRMLIGDARKVEAEEVAPIAKPIVFLPAGSNFEGVLLNGMDAPTSTVAQKTPVPALVRIKTDAILPNRYRYDVRECFVIVSGYGELSSERVNLRTVVLSCVKNDGAVIETKIDGYLVGEDGMVGIRGKVITKQGALLAKSFMAGFAGGIGAAMAPQPVQALNTTGSSTTMYQTPSLNNVLTSGTASGISQSAKSISQFYLDMAKQMFPVIEISPNRRVTLILEKGIEMNMAGDKIK